MKTGTLTGRATQALPEDRSSAHAGILDCQILPSGDLNLSPGAGPSPCGPYRHALARRPPQKGPGLLCFLINYYYNFYDRRFEFIQRFAFFI